MPIAAVTPALTAASSSLLPLAGNDDKRNLPAATTGTSGSPTAPGTAAPQAAPNPESDATISISPAASAARDAVRPVLSPVYAEIWRDGVRVAQVDVHGQVTSAEGVVAATGSGLAGPLLAAQRAVQAARQLGGEIRSAGQPVDGQTLLMRERLASTYTI